jgi:hypothetical protein
VFCSRSFASTDREPAQLGAEGYRLLNALYAPFGLIAKASKAQKGRHGWSSPRTPSAASPDDVRFRARRRSPAPGHPFPRSARQPAHRRRIPGRRLQAPRGIPLWVPGLAISHAAACGASSMHPQRNSKVRPAFHSPFFGLDRREVIEAPIEALNPAGPAQGGLAHLKAPRWDSRTSA